MRQRAEMHEFADGAELAAELAGQVAAALREGIALRGHAALAVSGGSTPGRFFDALSGMDIDWGSVTVTLVDERCVPANSDRSNLKLVCGRLLTARASAASVVPLYQGAGAAPEEAARIADAEIADLLPLDACILGMGNDGHTASFFPGGNNLGAALDPDGERKVLPMTAPGAGEPRVTMTLPVIAGSRFVALHIEGIGKKQVLDAAMQPGPAPQMPVRAVLDAVGPALAVYWAA